MSPTHRAVHDLADQLVVEYGDTLPPGQILALVYRTAHSLAHLPGAGTAWQSGACEELVRRALSERIDAVDTRVGAA